MRRPPSVDRPGGFADRIRRPPRRPRRPADSLGSPGGAARPSRAGGRWGHARGRRNRPRSRRSHPGRRPGVAGADQAARERRQRSARMLPRPKSESSGARAGPERRQIMSGCAASDRSRAHHAILVRPNGGFNATADAKRPAKAIRAEHTVHQSSPEPSPSPRTGGPGSRELVLNTCTTDNVGKRTSFSLLARLSRSSCMRVSGSSVRCAEEHRPS